MLVPRPPFSLTHHRPVERRRARHRGPPGAPRRPGATPPARSPTRAAVPCSPALRRASWRSNVSMATSGRPSARIFSTARPMRAILCGSSAFAGSTDTWSNPQRRTRSPLHPRTRRRWPRSRHSVACRLPWWTPRTSTRSIAALRRSCSACSEWTPFTCASWPRTAPGAAGTAFRRLPDGSAPGRRAVLRSPSTGPTGVGRVFETGQPLNITDARQLPGGGVPADAAVQRGEPPLRAAGLLGRGARGDRAGQRDAALVPRGGDRVRLHDGQPGVGRPQRARDAQSHGRPGRQAVRARACRERPERPPRPARGARHALPRGHRGAGSRHQRRLPR